MPAEHGGQDQAFTAGLEFSEDIADIGYAWVRDTLAAATGGTVRRALRVERSPARNLAWTLNVNPSSSGVEDAAPSTCRAQHMADAVSHDQNFKNLIVDYPRDALAFFAAEEAPRPEDDVQITPVRREQLKDRLGDRHRELDVPLLVSWSDGRREAVAFALEEESDWRRFSPHRLAHYCLDLAEMLGTDRVVPVVVFLRAAGRAPASLSLGTERRPYLAFDYLACELAETPAERWLDSDNVVARVNLPNMRSAGHDRVEVYARAVSGLLRLEADSARRAKYMEFIDIYAALTDNERRSYGRLSEEDSVVTGYFQQMRNEAIEQGIEQGRVEGERAVLARQLRRRFGGLPPAAAERLRQAAETDLEVWADNVLDAETLDDVFRSVP